MGSAENDGRIYSDLIHSYNSSCLSPLWCRTHHNLVLHLREDAETTQRYAASASVMLVPKDFHIFFLMILFIKLLMLIPLLLFITRPRGGNAALAGKPPVCFDGNTRVFPAACWLLVFHCQGLPVCLQVLPGAFRLHLHEGDHAAFLRAGDVDARLAGGPVAEAFDAERHFFCGQVGGGAEVLGPS